MPNPYVSHIQLGTGVYDIYDNAAHTAINDQESAISSLQSGLGEADSSIEDLTTKYNTVNGLYNMLNSQVDGLETRMGTAESDIDTAQGDITNLETKQNSQASQISALQSTSSSHTSSINSINNALSHDWLDGTLTFTPLTQVSSVSYSNNTMTIRRLRYGTSTSYIFSIFGYVEFTLSSTNNPFNAKIKATLPGNMPISNRTLYNFGTYTMGGKSQGDPWVQGTIYGTISNNVLTINLTQTATTTATKTVYLRCSCVFIV